MDEGEEINENVTYDGRTVDVTATKGPDNTVVITFNQDIDVPFPFSDIEIGDQVTITVNVGEDGTVTACCVYGVQVTVTTTTDAEGVTTITTVIGFSSGPKPGDNDFDYSY